MLPIHWYANVNFINLTPVSKTLTTNISATTYTVLVSAREMAHIEYCRVRLHDYCEPT